MDLVGRGLRALVGPTSGALRARAPLATFLLLGGCAAPVWGQDVSAEMSIPRVGGSVTETADILLLAGDLEGAFRMLEDRLSLVPDDYEVRWRATRAALGLGIAEATRDRRQAWLRVADEHGRALERQRPDAPEAMGWAVAARGRRALEEDGTRTIASLARETWELTGRLLELEPGSPLGNHARGKLHQEVMRLPAVARLFARLLLGNALVGQTRWELAEAHLERAVAADPGMVLFYLDLGETYGFQGKWVDAEAAYRRGLDVPNRYPLDEGFKATMRQRLLEIPGRAHGGGVQDTPPRPPTIG